MNKKLIVAVLCLTIVLTNSSFVMAASNSYEPNNTYGTAAYVPLKYIPVRAEIYQQYDQDWFKTEYYSNGYATVSLTPPAGKNYGLIVHYKDINGDIVEVARSTSAGAGQVETVTFPVTDDYEYLFFVYAPTYDYSTEQYELKQVSYTPTLDAAYEDNNSFDTAFEIDLFENNVSASISSSNDVDYYKFTSDYTGEMGITLIGLTTRNYDFIVYDNDNNNTIGNGNGTGQSDTVTVDIVQGREYVVIVYGATSSDYRSNVPYTLFKSN